jgi:methyltransferase (TIGR00027 family)
MEEREASGTAAGVAMLRAAHQLIDGEPKILDDRVSLRLLAPGAAETILREADRLRGPGATALRSHVLARSRYAEDRLADAARRGVRQAVALGAGLDTFSHRQPEWARALRIYEVDHPASQRAKLDRLARAAIPIPPNVRHVPADLEASPPAEALRAAGFDASAPAFFSILGVTTYLSEAAGDAIFAFIASLPAGTEAVFTFSPPAPGGDAPDSLAARAAAMGEPWRTRQGPDEIGPKLRALGFSRVDFVPAEEIERMYFRGRTDGLPAPRASRIARAVV